jgi:lipoprotein-anchoring transpeptidase ErfK/SrfK
MRTGRLVFAAVLTASLAASGVAHAGPLTDFFDTLFSGGGSADSNEYAGQVLWPEDVSPERVVPWQFQRREVEYQTNEKPGTIIIDPDQHFLYFVEGNGEAIRYGVGVGREGFGWRGTVHIGRKAEWPGWTPPPQMVVRERARGVRLPTYMAGGPDNPLGARAMYLYNGSGDTGFRIHGTSEPWTIGLNVSSGCIRLNNDDVTDLFNHAQVGAKVIVM